MRFSGSSMGQRMSERNKINLMKLINLETYFRVRAQIKHYCYWESISQNSFFLGKELPEGNSKKFGYSQK